MAKEVSQSFKRVVGRRSSSHHVRVDTDCECGDSDQMIDAGATPVWGKTLCYTDQSGPFLQATLTLTSTSVVVIMAAVVSAVLDMGSYDIQRPLGTKITDQETILSFGGAGANDEPALVELEACEELPAGTYTWYLVSNFDNSVYAAWIKAHSVT